MPPCAARRDTEATTFHIVGIGASSGGIKALQIVLASLPPDLDAAVLIVQHLAPRYATHLPAVLSRHARLPISEAVDGAAVCGGMVVTAPPNLHLGVSNGHIVLSDGPLVHFLRPSVDTLLESIAVGYRTRSIGVVLTGSGNDGTCGIRAIKANGGTTIVQDPDEAEQSSMPAQAWATGCVDMKLPLVAIAPALTALVQRGHA